MRIAIRRTLTVTLTATVAFAAHNSLASGQGCVGAPGVSAVEQYCEAVPDADGGRQSPRARSGSSGDPAPSNALPAGVAGELRKAGEDGNAVERLVDGTASDGSTRSGVSTAKSEAKTRSGGGPVQGPNDPSTNPLIAATKAAANGPTAGAGVLWSMVGIGTLGAIGFVGLRRRGGLTGLEELSDSDESS